MKYFIKKNLQYTLVLLLLLLYSATSKLQAQPINDLCENALGITCNAEVPGTTINATYEENVPFCSDRNYNSSVWYSFTPAMLDTTSISTDIYVRIEFEGEEDVAELSARILSGSCDGTFVAEDCSTFYSGGNLTIRDPVVGEKYYIMVSGVNGFEGDFTIRINKGGESCLITEVVDITANCAEGNSNEFTVDLEILNFDDNPSGFIVNNGDFPNITEPGIVTLGPFEGEYATITLIGLDLFNVIGPITIFPFCNCSGAGYSDRYTYGSGFSVESLTDTVTLYKPADTFLEGCDSTIWVTDINNVEETTLSSGDTFTFVPDSARTVYSVTYCDDCERLIQKHDIDEGFTFRDGCYSTDVNTDVTLTAGSGSNLFYTISIEIVDTASCNFLHWVTSISNHIEGNIYSTETSIEVPYPMFGATFYGIVECEDFLCVEEVKLDEPSDEDDNDENPIIIPCPDVSAGEISIASQYVCHANQPELTVTGQQVGSGTSLYYVFHDNPNLSTTGYTDATSVYAFSFENQAAPVSILPCASTIYVTAFVSETVASISELDLTESCIEFSNTVSFTYLCQTNIAISEQCYNNGTYDLFVTITGGLPQVDNTATYTVLGSVYNGGNIYHNQTFSISNLADGSNYDIEVIDNANCGAYVIGEPIQCDKLPVELLFFNGEAIETGNLLKWATATEINNDYFTIESSIDGINYSKLKVQQGSGTSSESNEYKYLDRNAQNSLTYYRLSQTDFDGTTRIVAYTNVTRAERQDVVLLNTFPNPFESELNLNIYSNAENEALLSLTNMLGANLIELQISLQNGNNTIELNTASLPTGLYMLSLQSKNSHQYFKLLKD